MKVSLINPEKEFLPPFGILYLASVLEKRSDEVKVIEFLNTKINKNNIKKNSILFKESLDYSPDIIGITCMSSQVSNVKKLIKLYKEKVPHIPIIVGGPHPTAVQQELLDIGADFAVLGEGEETLPELIDAIKYPKELESIKGIAFKKNKELIITKPRQFPENLDNIPFPAYHLIDYNSYINMKFFGIRGLWIKCGRILTSRGCPGI